MRLFKSLQRKTEIHYIYIPNLTKKESYKMRFFKSLQRKSYWFFSAKLNNNSFNSIDDNIVIVMS